jgi:hypothetical protein
MVCWKCGESVELPPAGRVGTRDACARCGSDLHSCRNCDFYDPGKNNQCSEPQAEWVRDKEAGNYCDYYRPNPAPVRAGPAASPAESAKKKFDSLFKM